MAVTIDGSASVTINNGAVLGITSGTAVASTSGTSIDFTGLPSWIKRITVMFVGVSTSGTSLPIVKLGVSGTPESSGYLSGAFGATSSVLVGWASATTGFNINSDHSGGDIIHGTMVITLSNQSTNTWTSCGNINNSSGSGYTFAGSKSLAGTLNMVRITTVNGTNTFDAGSINILYE
jgi:hypothetical protein